MVTADRHLTPADVAVALRSFPRRFRGVLARPDDDREDPDELVRRPGPAGESAIDQLAAAQSVVEVLEGLLRTPRAADGAATPDLGRPAPAGATGPLDAALDRFEQAAGACADRVDAVANDDWAVTLGDGAHLLAVAQDAVAHVADRVRRADAILAEVR